MLRFFSKMRYKLAAENQAAKYLRYAVGEILLVVIGILIALQVNNWNKQRLDTIEARKIKTNLHEEFLQNRPILNSSIIKVQKAIQSNLALMNLIGASKTELNKHNPDSLFYFSFESIEYNPSNNALNDVLNSGRMSLIEDKELRNSLMFWTSEMERVHSTYNSSTDWVNNHILSFLLPYMSFKEMDRYGNNPGSGESKITTDYYPLFQHIELENLLDAELYFLQKGLDELTSIVKIQEKIIELTNDK